MIQWLIFIAMAVITSSCKSAHAHAGAAVKDSISHPTNLADHPDIVFLLLDDQEAFTPFWEAMPQTRAMLGDAVEFTNAFGTSPICCPGRVTTLSGQYQHNTGVYTIAGPNGLPAWTQDEINRAFPVTLQSLGYYNILIGKGWKGDESQIGPGWSQWHEMTGNDMYAGYNYTVAAQKRGEIYKSFSNQGYSTDFLKQVARNAITNHVPVGQPMFMWLGPTAPHLPLPPPTRYIQEAKRKWPQLPHRPNYNEQDLSDKPRWLQTQASVRSQAVPYADNEYWMRMGSLMAVDDMMDWIKQDLIAKGRWQNTILIVTSDNGYNLGSHRLIHKQAPWEESLKVPMWIGGPGVRKGQTDALVTLMDIAPTLIDLAGGTPDPQLDGRSLKPFLTAEDKSQVQPWRDAVVGAYITGGVHSGYVPRGTPMEAGYKLDMESWEALRTKTHKFIRWTATNETELYDLKSDPFELESLVSARSTTPEHQALANAMQARLDILKHCRGDTCNQTQ